MARIPAAYNPHDTLAPDDPAELAHRLNRRFHFHQFHAPLAKNLKTDALHRASVNTAFSPSVKLYSSIGQKKTLFPEGCPIFLKKLLESCSSRYLYL
jgi:hypothetical protein